MLFMRDVCILWVEYLKGGRGVLGTSKVHFLVASSFIKSLSTFVLLRAAQTQGQNFWLNVHIFLPTRRASGIYILKSGYRNYIEYLQGAGVVSMLSDAVLSFSSWPHLGFLSNSPLNSFRLQHSAGSSTDSLSGLLAVRQPGAAYLSEEWELLFASRLSMPAAARAKMNCHFQ